MGTQGNKKTESYATAPELGQVLQVSEDYPQCFLTTGSLWAEASRFPQTMSRHINHLIFFMPSSKKFSNNLDAAERAWKFQGVKAGDGFNLYGDRDAGMCSLMFSSNVAAAEDNFHEGRCSRNN